jgi:benzoate/toluate 1,2-dioxygenase subunit beta
MTENLARVQSVLADAVVDDAEAGVHRANRHGLASHGRREVHRGAMICRRKTDNRTTLTCPFHGWTFRNDGTLLKVKDPDGAGYPATILYREARYLDDREFERWLECYADDVEYWMPAWDDNELLTENPQTDISLIYYDNKGGLEDRVFRIRTERSSATSIPEPRTSHNISNVEVIERRGDIVDVRFNWHTMYFRYRTVDPYYGTSFYTVDFSGDSPLIRRKTVVLKNDYIHHVVDTYHV